ncbi:Sec1-like protein [Mycena maculata]|uniref:Sec1-like protein n=1 Tax=Mycena maculata TaxID=230809 RepID=A0AAD7JFG4_9AGAR|nr:Sec1-like protein [Mycena maculata]
MRTTPEPSSAQRAQAAPIDAPCAPTSGEENRACAYKSVEGDFATKILAFFMHDILEGYKGRNPMLRPQGTLLITERSMDMITPFVHEFTYQAMALPIKDGMKYRYKFWAAGGKFEDKTATLTDEDTVWTEIRHMHMQEAILTGLPDYVYRTFQEFYDTRYPTADTEVDGNGHEGYGRPWERTSPANLYELNISMTLSMLCCLLELRLRGP